jgi:hypothetical protein
MNRIDIATGVDFEEFKAAFEKAAPPFDPATVREIAERGGSWDEVLAAAAINAPNGLMVYATIDGLPLFALAGHTTKAVEYLLGNHTIAETMFRRDPKTLLYAPLRVLIHADAEGNAVYSMDQPSAAFGSLGIAQLPSDRRERRVVERFCPAMAQQLDVRCKPSRSYFVMAMRCASGPAGFFKAPTTRTVSTPAS